ncbi:nucleoside 2-deoxyribosyltransferase [Companilactobacillus sp. DQM5]|uniref:nucleoside 2-deoxyribosyltransferase n=1 Tax=Companilactobacillus sp. DQM5 TaxID=3463359 RepID=UPI00405A1852
MNIYFANGLFSKADFNFNEKLVKKIRDNFSNFDIYLPQENASINDKSAYADSKMIAQADTEKLLQSDLVIAVLDGITIDAGVASEIGVAYANNIPIIGLYTDSRQLGFDNKKKLDALSKIAENQFHYLNLYTTGLIKLNGEIVNSEEKLLNSLNKYSI